MKLNWSEDTRELWLCLWLLWIFRIVESVGEGVSDMNEGDLVVPIFNGECGDCKYCKCEKTNKCERFGVDAMKKVMVSDGATRFYTMDGKPIFHFLNTSTFTEYTVVDSACIVKIHIDGSNGDLNRNIKRLTLLSCGVSSGKILWSTSIIEDITSLILYACAYMKYNRVHASTWLFNFYFSILFI